MTEWLKVLVSKTSVPSFGTAGSNPALSAILLSKKILALHSRLKLIDRLLAICKLEKLIKSSIQLMSTRTDDAEKSA